MVTDHTAVDAYFFKRIRKKIKQQPCNGFLLKVWCLHVTEHPTISKQFGVEATRHKNILKQVLLSCIMGFTILFAQCKHTSFL